MKWWQVYYAFKDSFQFGWQVSHLLMASFYIRPVYNLPNEQRRKEWERGLNYLFQHPLELPKIVQKLTNELALLNERLGVKDSKESERIGQTTKNIDYIHAMLLMVYRDVEKVYNLRVFEVAETLKAIQTAVELITKSKADK